jgi:ParB family chromosome partitioning protein
MAAKRKGNAHAGAALPRFARVALDRILEPELAARATMSDTRMQDLIESFRTVGQIEPITLEQHEGMFAIITGHRRFLAARHLKWADMAAMVYAEGTAQAAAMMLHENLCREELNPAEEALFMAQAREKFALDEEGLCKLFHRSADYIASRFALLRGDPEIFAALQKGELRLGVAHELNRISDEAMRAYYLDLARRSDPSARVVHGWVNDWLKEKRPPLPIMNHGAAALGGESADGASPLTSEVEPGAPPPDGSAPAAPFFGCELCGGTKDPYNLVEVRMHKWHWTDILESVKRAAKGST